MGRKPTDLQPNPDLDDGVSEPKLTDVLLDVIFLKLTVGKSYARARRDMYDTYHVLQEHRTGGCVRRPVTRHDALDAGVLRCREEQALRVEKVRGEREHHDVRPLEKSD